MDGMGSRFGEKLTPEELSEYNKTSIFDVIGYIIVIIVIVGLFAGKSSSKPGGATFSPDDFDSYEEYEEFVDNYDKFYDDYYDDYDSYSYARNW